MIPRMSDEPARPWTRLSTRLIWESPWYDLRQDTVKIHTGATITYTYQDHHGAVVVVPITPAGQVVLLRQYRYVAGEWCWEVPAGGRDPGESSLECAARELAEEAGYTAARIEPLGQMLTSKAVSNERLELFLATGATPAPDALRHEATELMSVHLLPLAEAVALVHGNAIRDGATALALLLAAARLGQASGG